MEALQARLNQVHPIPGRDYGVNLVSLYTDTVGDVRSALTLLLGAVGIFLVIACANITSLLLLRATERRKELAVRLSMGAGKGRLMGQLLTEGIVLSALGGGLGLLLAVASLGPFLRLLPGGTPRLESVSLDVNVLIFSLGLSTLTGLLVSVVPGLMASSIRLNSVLNDSSRGTSSGRNRNRLQLGLLVGEIAMTFVLLAGAGLLTRSFSRLTAMDPGFSSDGVVIMRMDLRGERYAEKELVRQAYGELTERLRALPGVSNVTLASPGPFRNWWSNGTTVDTGEGFVETNTQQESVSANYFEMMEIPLRAGRTFTPDEVRDEAPVIVVNEAMERAFWPETGALGQRVKLGRVDNETPWLVVVGVVGDVRRRLDGEPYTTLFHPMGYQGPAVLMKTAGDPSLIMAGAREALKAVDPQVPISSLETLDAEISRTVAGPRVRTLILSAFSLFATFLAILGIFGLLAHAVAQRTNEIGIRMALGAEKGAVLRDVLRRGLGVLALGLPLGLLVTFVTVRALEPFLFRVGRTDPGTLAAVATLLSVCTLLASVIPARRAMGVDPVEALRSE
jgi:putative ABC transport system permease protein